MFPVQDDPRLAVKVLAPARRRGKAEKVQVMVECPPAGAHDLVDGFPVLTWPRAAVLDGPEFAGYTMTRVHRADFVPFYQLATATRRKDLGGAPITFDRLVLLAMRLCHVVRTLHRFGYAVGDLNDRNVLVSRRLTPLLMDTDSFQVPRAGRGHYPCLVGDALYWPPELLDVDLATHSGSRESSDRYALGVLLFQLFMNGLRPYQARGTAVAGLESLADKTRAGLYPWASPRPGILEPPAGAPDYRALPRPMRAAFEQCFVSGHAKARRRPSADDWHEVLAQVRNAGFQACARTTRHVYANGESTCPWCADPNDPFDATPAALPTTRRGRPSATLARRGSALRTVARTAAQPRPRVAPQRPRVMPLRPAAPPVAPAPQASRVPVRPNSSARSRTPRPKPSARKAKATAGKSKPKRRRPARARTPWPSKARWLTVLTSAVLLTYLWMAS